MVEIAVCVIDLPIQIADIVREIFDNLCRNGFIKSRNDDLVIRFFFVEVRFGFRRSRFHAVVIRLQRSLRVFSPRIIQIIPVSSVICELQIFA